MRVQGNVDVILGAVDNASSTLNKVKVSMALMGNTLQQLGGGFESVGTIMQGFAAGGTMGAVTAAIGEVISALNEAMDTFTEFETALVKVTSATGATGDALVTLTDELTEAAKAAGVEFAVGATAAMEALESLVKAGLEGEEAVIALDAALALATVEVMSTAEAADMLVGILGMFKLSAEDAAHATDVLVNASMIGIATASEFANGLAYVGGRAQEMGFSLEEVTAALVAMNNQGINATSAGQYLNQMFTSLIQNSDKLGFSIYDANGAMLSLGEISGNLTDKLNSFATQEERNAYMTEMFGARASIAANALLGLGDSGDEVRAMLEELASSLDESGSAMDQVDARAETLAGTQARLDAMMENLQLTIGEALAPVMMAFAGFMEETFIPILEWIIGVFIGIGDAIAPVVKFFQDLWTIISSKLQPAIEAFLAWLKPLIDVIIAFAEALNFIVTAILDGLAAIGQAVADEADAIEEEIDDMTEVIVEDAEEIIDILDEAADAAGDSGRDMRDQFRYNRDAFREMADDMDDIADDIEDTFEDIEDVVEEIAEGMARTWEQIVADTNKSIEDGLLTEAQDNFHDFVNCVTNKQADMVDEIDGYLEDMAAEYMANVDRIAALQEAGLDAEAALFIAKNEELFLKMQQLLLWRSQLIDDTYAGFVSSYVPPDPSRLLPPEDLTPIVDPIRGPIDAAGTTIAATVNLEFSDPITEFDATTHAQAIYDALQKIGEENARQRGM